MLDYLDMHEDSNGMDNVENTAENGDGKSKKKKSKKHKKQKKHKHKDSKRDEESDKERVDDEFGHDLKNISI